MHRYNHKQAIDLTGLREQIKDNVTVLDEPSMSEVNIILAKSSQFGQLTAYVLNSTGRSYVKGNPRSTAGEALESLLEALAELAGEKLAEKFERMEQNRASNAMEDAHSSRYPEIDDHNTTTDSDKDASNGESAPRDDDDGLTSVRLTDSNLGAVNGHQHNIATSLRGEEFQDLVERAEMVLMQTGSPYRHRPYSYTSESGHVYTTYDGSCGGFGPNALVQYCAG
ncbi:hypothetical protein M433DRAFT_6023 [Acidomyces richmondensis BFW]|nr:hypothetical protein M433DRAFT_6023 [Acidomyces richmondensis BFW]